MALVVPFLIDAIDGISLDTSGAIYLVNSAASINFEINLHINKKTASSGMPQSSLSGIFLLDSVGYLDGTWVAACELLF